MTFNLKKLYDVLNTKFRERLRKKNILYALENIQIITGICGILYGLVLFFYFFVKISRTWSLLFLLSIIIGIALVYSTKRGIINDEKRGKKFPI